MSRGLRTTSQLRDEVARLERLTQRQRATINRLQDEIVRGQITKFLATPPAASSSHSRRIARAALERARLFLRWCVRRGAR